MCRRLLESESDQLSLLVVLFASAVAVGCPDSGDHSPAREDGTDAPDAGIEVDSHSEPRDATFEDTGRSVDTRDARDAGDSESGASDHPLPLAGNWNCPKGRGFSPKWQIQKIREGRNLLFTYRFKGNPEPSEEWKSTYEPIFRELARRNAPFTFRWGNWLDEVSDTSASSSLEVWTEAGKNILEPFEEKLTLMQKWYPDPPYIVMLSNNEGKGAENGKPYMERYRAMFDAMRDVAGDWGDAFRFIGYAWGGQANINIYGHRTSPLAWNGTSARNYRARGVTDHTTYSTPVTAMNLILKREFYRVVHDRPHFEISTWWDEKTSVEPERYGGMVTWSLWMARPKSIRDFTSWGSGRDSQWPYYRELVDAVDQVHDDETLKEFWKFGEPVVDPEIEIFTHVIDAPPGEGDREDGNLAGYVDEQKLQYFERLRHHWYHLPTSVDPPTPDAPDEKERVEYPREAEFTVWAQAKVLGEKPDRRWLVYAYAPRGAESAVEIRIPDGVEVTIDVPQGGVFVVVDEGEADVVERIPARE